MSLRINLNSAALNAHRNLISTDDALSKSIERLSSGYRINSAADDPAGLAISENLKAQVNGLGQAIANSNDASNMVKTADGALSDVQSLLQSMRTLALHAANTGANDTTSTAADQTQITSDIAALNRISANTQFGNKKLLDGTAGVTGQTTNANVTFLAGSAATVADTYALNVTAIAVKANVTSTVNISGGLGAGAVGNLTINGQTIAIAQGDTDTTVISKINAVSSTTGVGATASGVGLVKLTQASYGLSPNIIVGGTAATLTAIGLTAGTTANGVNATATLTAATGGTVYTLQGTGASFTGTANTALDGLSFTATPAATGAAGNIVITNSSLTFQIGANAGQTTSQALNTVQANKLGVAATGLVNTTWASISDIDVTKANGAQDALKLIDAAISQISTNRAQLGALQQNLQTNVSSLGVAQENIAASQSTIRDTDMAAEMVNFTRNQILMQAGSAMLTQANQAPQALLAILKG